MIVGMDLIIELLKTTLFSAYLTDENPISLILAAPPEHLKTASLMTLEGNKAVVVTALTPFGFIKDYYPDIKEGKLKYLLIPDMFTLLSNRIIRGDIIGMLLDLTEHGILNISKYWNRGSFNIIEKVKMGIIMCSTPDVLTDKRHYWLHRNGFISRFLVLSYQYGNDLTDEIINELKTGGAKIEIQSLEFLSEDLKVTCRSKYITKLDAITSEVRKKQNSRGIRLTNIVRKLLKSNALKHKRTEVNDEDVVEVGSFLKYANYDMQPIKPFEMVKKEVKKELRI